MCTILLRYDPGAHEAVVLAANRDEFRGRAADDPREIAPGVFAGRDRTAGGTWLAVSRAGIAALTNVRTGLRDPAAPTRGTLPLAALAGRLPRDLTPYNAFNLLVVDRDGARVVTHPGAGAETIVTPLGPGSHVVDNEPYGVRSPRAARAATLLARQAPDLVLLGDHGNGDDGFCHHGEEYGTVSSTLVALDRELRVVRYLHRTGLPCEGSPVDLATAARAVIDGSRPE